jgi:hypothetical protein
VCSSDLHLPFDDALPPLAQTLGTLSRPRWDGEADGSDLPDRPRRPFPCYVSTEHETYCFTGERFARFVSPDFLASSGAVSTDEMLLADQRGQLQRFQFEPPDQKPFEIDEAGADEWISAFLTLESAGWKAQDGAALAIDDGTRNFFSAAISEGLKRGRVEIIRMRVGNDTVAMLVNFLACPGSFSFKIAYDETYARYSPGILIEKANLQRLADPSFGWMDSCAVEDHPMINSLWRGRRDIVRIALPRKGARAAFLFNAVRLAETSWLAVKQFRRRRLHANGASNDDNEL